MVSTLSGQARRRRSRATGAAWLAGVTSAFAGSAYVGGGLSPFVAGTSVVATVLAAVSLASLTASRRAERRSARPATSSPSALAGFAADDSTTDMVAAQ